MQARYCVRRFAGLSVLALLLASARAALAQGAFGSPVLYPGTDPIGLAAGDLNGDNRPDLVTTTSTGVVILLNQAAAPGTFVAAGSYPVASANGVAIGDVDGDGRPDIVAGSTNKVVVLRASGAAGSFLPPVGYATNGGETQQVALADLDQDNRLDIAVANRNNSVGVLLGVGGGAFGPVVNYFGSTPAFTSPFPVDLAVGDLNGDNSLDLVASNPQAGRLELRLTSATLTGTLATPTYYGGGGSTPVGVAVADLNRDGRLDMVAGNPVSGKVGVLLAAAAPRGAFAAAVSYGLNGGPSYVAVADLNGDGWPDVVVSDIASNALHVLLGQRLSPGTLGPATAYPTGGSSPQRVVLADLNGDSRPDAATTTSSGVAVLLNAYPLATTPTQPAADALTVYPNPAAAADAFTVAGPALAGATRASLELLDALGRTVYRQVAAPAPGGTLRVGAALPAGLYTLRLHAGEQVLTRRVVLH